MDRNTIKLQLLSMMLGRMTEEEAIEKTKLILNELFPEEKNNYDLDVPF